MSSIRRLVVTLFLLSSAAIFAQQADEKAVLEELSKRNVLDVEALKKRLDRLSTLSALELDAELKLLEKEQEAILKDWQKIDSLRRTKRPGVVPPEIRAAMYVLKQWQSKRELESKLLAIQDREEEAFTKRYKEPLTEFSPKYKEWQSSDDFRSFEKDRSEVKTLFAKRTTDLADDALHGNADTDRPLTRVQERILDGLQHIDQVREQASAALRSKQGLKAEIPSSPKREIETPDGDKLKELRAWLRPWGQPLTVGKPVVVLFAPRVGKEPRTYLAVTSEGQMRVHSDSVRYFGLYRGVGAMFFFFKTPGEHLVDITCVDGRGDSAAAVVRFTIKSKDEKKEEEKKDEKPAKKSDPPKPEQPKPEQKKTEATSLPLLTPFPGTYRAHVWCTRMPPPGAFPFGPAVPTPVTVTIDIAGNISGRCNYTCPRHLIGAALRKYPNTHWSTRFTIEGRVDWQTGKIQLSIPDQHVHNWWGYDNYKNERIFEQATTLMGRHTSDPHLERPSTALMGRMGAAAPEALEKYGLPNMAAGSKGTYRITGSGWCALPGMDPGTLNVKAVVKSALGRVKSLDKLYVNQDAAFFQKEHDQFINSGQTFWYLKLLGLDVTADDLKKLDIVGTAFWPEKLTTAKVGEPIHVQYYGVLSNNYAEPRDLTEVAEWQAPPGLQQVQPGVFRSDTPGSYKVRARAKGKDGNWMEGFLTINIAA